MKLRKLILVLSLIALMAVLFAFAVSADEILFTPAFFDVVADGPRAEYALNLFDGDIKSGGLYGDQTHPIWYGGVDDYVLITFKEEVTITGMAIFVTGNWTKAKVEFIDADGNVIHLVTGDSYDHRIVADGPASGPEGARKEVFIPGDLSAEEEEIWTLTVKQIKLTITDLKWNGHHRTFTLSEIEVKGLHDHIYDELDTLIKKPTCVEPGIGKYDCFCGSSEERAEEPTGNHSMIEDIVFRNGYDKPGYKGTVCSTCSTQDSYDTENEIPPLFTVLGYSANETTAAISFGIRVNYNGIEKYNSLSEYPVKFGIVAVSRAVFAEGNPLAFGVDGIEKVNDFVCMKDCTDADFGIISYKIDKIPEAHKETEIVLSAYLFDGKSDIYYIGEESSLDALTVSYQGILNNLYY